MNLSWYTREEVQALARRFRIGMQPPKKMATAATVAPPPPNPFSPGSIVLAGPEDTSDNSGPEGDAATER